ncbi:hypothetical protein EZV73_12480 [Acidaminobacter sp. JC074]|uniref:hypothetical protein n=1 Tax=Acidaminobacter sp. JC074 TaxID=2530199 RepID=UPI001F10BBEE|nr:hypothetical protein [Acidaminobacter sp. JC074]MCH4888399.1 hypothetical protein [Acidaminobacter sp. JC074]
MDKVLKTFGLWSFVALVLTTLITFSSYGFASEPETFSDYEMKMNELEIQMIKENIQLWK